MFDKAHGQKTDRVSVPPVLVFSNTGTFRDVDFLGLAIPGVESLDSNSDLVALWRMKDGKRFQSYQAKFTVLDCQVVPKSWIEIVKVGNPLSTNCPTVWRAWVEKGVSRPLKAASRILRLREEHVFGVARRPDRVTAA
jgi:Restriction endonuclease AspBHI N-terminal